MLVELQPRVDEADGRVGLRRRAEEELLGEVVLCDVGLAELAAEVLGVHGRALKNV